MDTNGYAAVRLCAPNDPNGNPRRCFLVLRDGAPVDVVDEGFLGDSAVIEPYPALRGVWMPRVNVAVSEYRRYMQLREDLITIPAPVE